MSKLHIAVTLKCVSCGEPLTLSYLAIDRPDPDGVLLRATIDSLSKTAKCDRCLYNQREDAKRGK